MRHARAAFALLLLTGLLFGGVMVMLAAPADQLAQPQVDVWMSATQGGSSVLRFPAGTTTVYVVVKYTDFANNTAQVILRDDLGVTLFENSTAYTGNGTRSFAITGDQLYTTYFMQALSFGNQLQQQLAQAAAYAAPGAPVTATQQVTTTIELSMSQAMQMESALQGARRFSLTANAEQHTRLAIEALDQVLVHGEEARTAGKSLEEIRALIGQMQQAAATAQAETRQAYFGFKAYLPIVIRKARMGMQSAEVAQLPSETAQPQSRPLPTTPGCDSNLQPRAYSTNVYMTSGQGQLLPVASFEWVVGNPGSARYLDLEAEPSDIFLQTVTLPSAVHTSAITATVRDAQCLPVADGVQVRFTTNDSQLGTVSPTTAATFTDVSARASGLAVTLLTAGSEPGPGYLTVTATVGSATAGRQVSLLGGPHTIQVSAEYDYLRVDEGATGVVAVVRDQNNRNVADGTPVTFSINPPGFLYLPPNQTTVPTAKGAARTTVSALAQRGPASVIATVGAITGSANLAVVGPAHTVTVTAEPSTIYVDSAAAFSDIHIQAVDDAGNPAPDSTEFKLEILDSALGYFEFGFPPAEKNQVMVTTIAGHAVTRLLAGSPNDGTSPPITGTSLICASSETDPADDCTEVTFALTP